MGLSIDEIRCFLYLCMRSITFYIVPIKCLFVLSPIDNILDKWTSSLSPHFSANLPPCNSSCCRWQPKEGGGGGLVSSTGETADIHHLFVRYSLFTLCTIWWIIMGLPDQFVVVVWHMYSLNTHHVNTYVCTCTYVVHSVIHAIALQGCGDTKMHNCKLDKENWNKKNKIRSIFQANGESNLQTSVIVNVGEWHCGGK